MPKISVIVPVYNTEKTLVKCIDSILAQSFQDFELLLIDDGSKDASGIICDEYATRDNRIKVFHKTNGGASSARNLGIDNAVGEWVTFCDSDDWVYTNWLLTYAGNCENVDYVCQGLQTDHPLSRESDSKLNNYGTSYKGIISNGINLMHKSHILGYTVISLFKRSIIEYNSLRFDESYNLHEDAEFIFRYLVCCTYMCCVPNPGYYYYVPNFGRKYIIRNEYSLYESLYLNLQHILGDKCMDVSGHYLYQWLTSFLKLFKSLNYKDRVRMLRQFRIGVGKNILKSKLFFITRWVIYWDATSILASTLLSIQLYFKS